MNEGITIINGESGRIIQVKGGHRMSMKNGKWYIDGVEVDLNGDLHELNEINMRKVNLTINGNVGYIDNCELDTLNVQGNVEGDVSTLNGNVRCGNVAGNVTAFNGNVVSSAVSGKVATPNGNFICR